MRRKATFEELVDRNKNEIIQDEKALEEIEIRIDKKYSKEETQEAAYN